MLEEQQADFAAARPNPAAILANAPNMEAERLRLEAEREACERKLERLNAEQSALDIARQDAETRSEPALLDRLSRIASMRPDLRSAFHETLGNLQMLRLDKTLSEQQMRQTEMVLSAGTRLFEQVFRLLDISQIESDAIGPGIDHAVPLAGIAPDGDGAAQTQGGPYPPNEKARCLKVLIVDDIDVNRKIAAGFLTTAGHAVDKAENGVSAVIAASTMDFDVILMDISMPELDGIEATQRIRALPGARGRTPIIALTAFDSEEEIEACRRAGMNAHLAKPFRHDTLIEAVLGAAGQAENTGPVTEGAQGVFAADPALPLPSKPPGAQHGRAGGSSLRQTLQTGSAVPKSYAHLLAEERENYQAASDGADRPGQWRDIVSPWRGDARAMPPRRAAAAAADFTLRLRDVGMQRGHRRLVGDTLTCEPARAGAQHEFHWLVYVNAADADAKTFSARCDLWRWSRGAWQSIAAPGAAFLPDEVFEQGWRYCAPCIDPTATIDVS